MTTTKKLNYRKLLVIFVFQQHWEKLPVFHKSINLTWNIQNLNRKVKPWEIVILIQPTLYGTSISKIFSIFLKAHPPPPLMLPHVLTQVQPNFEKPLPMCSPLHILMRSAVRFWRYILWKTGRTFCLHGLPKQIEFFNHV